VARLHGSLVFRPPGVPRRLGLLLLATDLTTEGDFARHAAPLGLALHATRVPFANPTTPDSLRAMAPDLGTAAGLIAPGLPLAALYYACTAASVVIGDDEVRRQVAAGRPGVPVVTPPSAARLALRALGARSIAVVTPYTQDVTERVAGWFAGAGLRIVRAGCLGLGDDRDMARLDPGCLPALVRDFVPAAVDAVFVSCTALPSASAVPAMERACGRPVVTSNQAALWQALRLAGMAGPLAGLGRLGGLDLPPSPGAG
jgi:maleate isomerase